MMRSLPFLDAHMHLWDLNRINYAWLSPPFDDQGPNGNVESIAATYVLDDYLAEAARWYLVGAVHVEAGADPAQALDETDWLQEMAEARGLPSGIVAFARLDDPDVERLLAAHADRSRVRGIRQIVNWHPDPARTYTPRDLTLDEPWARGFQLLSKYGLSFDLQAYPVQFPALAKIIAQSPETPVIINHAGMGVDLHEDGREEWRRGMQALAALPNVFLKISGLGFAYRPWSDEPVRARVLECIDIFGTDRSMFASDFPTDRLFASFDRTLGAYMDAVADFSEYERRALFAGNANRVYRLGLDIGE